LALQDIPILLGEFAMLKFRSERSIYVCKTLAASNVEWWERDRNEICEDGTCRM